MTIKRLDNVGIAVENLDTAVEFLTEDVLLLDARLGNSIAATDSTVSFLMRSGSREKCLFGNRVYATCR